MKLLELVSEEQAQSMLSIRKRMPTLRDPGQEFVVSKVTMLGPLRTSASSLFSKRSAHLSPDSLQHPPDPLLLAESREPQLRLLFPYTWTIYLSWPQVSFLLILKNKNNSDFLNVSLDTASSSFPPGKLWKGVHTNPDGRPNFSLPGPVRNQRRETSQQPEE